LSVIRTHDPSVWTSESSSCLRPRGYCDRQRRMLLFLIKTFILSKICISRLHYCQFTCNTCANPWRLWDRRIFNQIWIPRYVIFFSFLPLPPF
jgi:hypothetical protein